MGRLKKGRIIYVFIAMFALVVALAPFCYAQGEAQGGTKELEKPTPVPGETETPAPEKVEMPTVNINTSFYSQYIWRGYELSHKSFVMFPSVTVSYKGFSLNWWGDIDTDYGAGHHSTTRPNDLQCWEQDYLLWYSNSWQKFNYTIGYIYYHTMPSHTQEVWVALGYSNFLNPTFSVWRDIEHGPSWYYNLALSHSFPISKDRTCWKYDMSFDVGGWVSYYDQDHYWQPGVHPKTDYSGFHDGQVWTGLKVPLSDVCSITPKIQYSFPLSTKARNNIKSLSFDGDDANFLYGGLILDYNF